MPKQLTSLQPPPSAGAVPVWEALRTEQQQAIRAPLARLISPLVLAQRTPLPEEHPNELVEQNHVVASLALGGRL